MLSGLRNKLSYQVALAAATISMFFLLVVGTASYVVMSGLIRGEIQVLLQGEAALRAEKMGDLLEGVVAAFRGLAANPLLVEGMHAGRSQLARLEPVLADFSVVNGVPAAVALFSRDGRPVMSAGRPWPTETNDPLAAAVVASGRPASRIDELPLSDELVVGQPVFMGAGVEGALLYRVRLTEVAARVAHEGGLALGARIAYRNRGVARSIALGAPLPDATMAAVTAVRLPPQLAGYDFVAEVSAGASLLAPPLSRLTSFFLLVGALTVLAVLAASAVMGRRLTRQLTRLTEAATSYVPERGDLARFAMAGEDEIARLGRAFAAMIERLDEAYRDLERRSQTLLSNAERIAHLGSSSWDLRSDRHTWSDQFHTILGLEPGDCIPSLDVLLGRVLPADRARVLAAIDGARTGARVSEDFRIIRPDGEVRVLHAQAEVATDHDSQPFRVDGTIEDITERKRLEDRLGALVRELRRSNEELEQFAYVASHDLRQPLRVVGSYVTLIEEALEGSLDDETREYMDFARDGVRRMDLLITDLLTYSRVGRTATDGPVDIDQAIQGAIADLQIEIEESGARVSVAQDMPVVMGDTLEMVRLFQNLIGNAIKYRRPDVPPEVQIFCTEEDGNWSFAVTDNGIGVPAEHSERVFGIFQRLHARDVYEGTGIGLAVCRKIVERHGGAIRVEARDGPGTTVRFTWPRQRVAEAVA
ncbi:MAG: sensor histidine kinase [Actinomycetota bacterium]